MLKLEGLKGSRCTYTTRLLRPAQCDCLDNKEARFDTAPGSAKLAFALLGRHPITVAHTSAGDPHRKFMVMLFLEVLRNYTADGGSLVANWSVVRGVSAVG